MNKYDKYDGVAIKKITVSEATFANSTEREVEPSWINFFYGNNGTGKSTVARAIKDNTGALWKDNTSPDDFNVLLFNRDFVTTELHFDLMPGVFMVSKESIENQKLIEEKQIEQKKLSGQIENINTAIASTQTEKFSLKEAFKNDCWKAAARYKKAFGAKAICTQVNYVPPE